MPSSGGDCKRAVESRRGSGAEGIMATEIIDADNNQPKSVDLDLIAQGVRMILEGIGEDPERAGLRGTPRRVAEMYAELTSGMREDPAQHVIPLPGDKHDEMVIVKDISIASLCEHHLARLSGAVISRISRAAVTFS